MGRFNLVRDRRLMGLISRCEDSLQDNQRHPIKPYGTLPIRHKTTHVGGEFLIPA
jgi:hypothetical protein